MILNKGRFLSYLRCKRLFYFSLNLENEFSSFDPKSLSFYHRHSQIAAFEIIPPTEFIKFEKEVVGKYLTQKFCIDSNYCFDLSIFKNNHVAAQKTAQILKEHQTALLYQPAFIVDFSNKQQLIIICDYIVKKGDYIFCFEVKGASKFKTYFIADILFQGYVLQKYFYESNQNIHLSSIELVHPNNQYIFQKELNLFSLIECLNGTENLPIIKGFKSYKKHCNNHAHATKYWSYKDNVFLLTRDINLKIFNINSFVMNQKLETPLSFVQIIKNKSWWNAMTKIIEECLSFVNKYVKTNKISNYRTLAIKNYGVGQQCKKDIYPTNPCPFFHHCLQLKFSNFNVYNSILTLYNVHFKQLLHPITTETTLSLINYNDTSLSFLKPNQKIAYQQWYMITHQLKEFINANYLQQMIYEQWFKFPMYFIDFETFTLIVPQIPNTKPWGKIPCQYSIHIIKNKAVWKECLNGNFSNLIHCDFLANNITNLNQWFLILGQHLQKDLTLFGVGLYFAYNSSYERDCLNLIYNNCDNSFPSNPQIIQNLCDIKHLLNIPSSNKFKTIDNNLGYYHEQFQGSFSIKVVLPSLAPEISYDKLEIHDGKAAVKNFYLLFTQANSNANEIVNNLRTYCKLDTFAMIKIYFELLKKM